MINGIKNFFKRIFDKGSYEKSFKKPVKSGTINVDATASVKTYNATSWDQIQDAIIKSCENISKKIKHQEDANMKNMKDLERYADKQSRTMHETVNFVEDLEFQHLLWESFLDFPDLF